MRISDTTTLVLTSVPLIGEHDRGRFDYRTARDAETIFLMVQEKSIGRRSTADDVAMILKGLEKKRLIRSAFIRGRRVYWRTAADTGDPKGWRIFFSVMAAASVAAQAAVIYRFRELSIGFLAVMLVATYGLIKNRRKTS